MRRKFEAENSNSCPIRHRFKAARTFKPDFFFVCSCGGVFMTSQDVAHTALAYGSRYCPRQSSDNGEIVWRCAFHERLL
jgi:hypothetical protein